MRRTGMLSEKNEKSSAKAKNKKCHSLRININLF